MPGAHDTRRRRGVAAQRIAPAAPETVFNAAALRRSARELQNRRRKRVGKRRARAANATAYAGVQTTANGRTLQKRPYAAQAGVRKRVCETRRHAVLPGVEAAGGDGEVTVVALAWYVRTGSAGQNAEVVKWWLDHDIRTTIQW